MTEHQESSSWDARSQFFGDSIQGVLFKNLPEVVNRHIHNWHVHCIFSFLKNNPPDKLLDVGCGYGRLSFPLKERFPSVQTVGLDVSAHYVELYRRNLKQPAFTCSLEQLPPDLGLFDCLLVVTVFMYLPKQNLEDALDGLLKHLKNGGKLIVIDKHCSGNFFLNPFGLRDFIARRSRVNEKTETGGQSFSTEEIRALMQKQGAIITDELRMPMTTIFIVPIYCIGKILPQGLAQIFLRGIFLMDRLLQKWPLPSLHAAYLIEKRMR